MKKVTIFKGQTSGDCECFCFDQRKGNVSPFEGTYQERDVARIYPSELLPVGVDGKYGTWSITVEFTPDATPNEGGDT